MLDHLNHLPASDDFRQNHQLDERPIIALLPGSRRQEIKRMLPLMLNMLLHFEKYQFAIAVAPAQPLSFYQTIIQTEKVPRSTNLHLISQQTYPLLQNAKAALVTSGTATLETALLGVPQVVCYTGNPLSYALARHLVSVKYISLVNLILDRPLLTELIQQDFNEKQLLVELHAILEDQRIQQILAAYQELKLKLGSQGASERTANLMLTYLKT